MLTQRGSSGPASVLLDVYADDAHEAIRVAEEQTPGLQVISAFVKDDELPWIDTRSPRLIQQAIDDNIEKGL